MNDRANEFPLPAREECLDWLRGWEVTEGLLLHCLAVAEVALRLARELQKHGVNVNVALVERAALLHDLDKVAAATRPQDHGEAAARWLEGRGFAELARLVRVHRIAAVLDEALRPRTWEERIVYYADKLVEGDREVSLSERFRRLKARYPGFADGFDRCYPHAFAIGEAINRICGWSPPDPLAGRPIRYCGVDCWECRTFTRFLAGDGGGLVNQESDERCCWLLDEFPVGRDCVFRTCCEDRGLDLCGRCGEFESCVAIQSFYAQPEYERHRRRMERMLAGEPHEPT